MELPEKKEGKYGILKNQKNTFTLGEVEFILYIGGGQIKLRKWMSEEKMVIVLEGIKEQKFIAEICR